jgi:sporulation protein YlmC with PRC-barrel domain
MISTNDVQNLVGQGGIVTDSDGGKIGKIGQVYLDNETGDPQWVTVSTGLFGTSESFVPLTSATTSGNDIQVPFSKDVIHDAPRVDADAEISEQEEAELFRY